MPTIVFPRLSEAWELLPLIRVELIAAAGRHTLPAGLALDLLPIVEQGVFGYEFQPDRESCDYVTIGRDDKAKPVVRRSQYCPEAPGTLRLATIDGRVVSVRDVDPWRRIRHRDLASTDWPAAAEAAWAELDALFGDSPRRAIEIHDARHREQDDALAFAHRHLAVADPRIEFCGVPDEAQYGYALIGSRGEHGQLSLRAPGTWALRWESAARVLSEQWTARERADPERAWARAAAVTGDATVPDVVPNASAASIAGAGTQR